MRREFSEKDKIIGNLQAEIEEKEQRLEQLKDEFERKQKELDELQGALSDALGEGKELDAMIDERDMIIADLENQLKGNKTRLAAAAEPTFKPSATDDVDMMLHEYLKYSGCDVPIRKVGGGYYIFGTKKIYAKIMNGKLVIRVGGGYMVIEEFIQTYGEIEKNKIQQIREHGGDPFAVDDKGSPIRFSRGGKSPNSGKSRSRSRGKRSPMGQKRSPRRTYN